MEFSAFLKWDAATWNLPDNKQENNEYFSDKPSLQSRYHSTTSRVSIFFRPLAASLLPFHLHKHGCYTTGNPAAHVSKQG